MITKQEAVQVVTKLGFEERKGRSKERGFKYYYKNRCILYTCIPKGKGELHIQDKLRKQLTLNPEQLALALKCPFKADHYLAHLVEIGKASSDD